MPSSFVITYSTSINPYAAVIFYKSYVNLSYNNCLDKKFTNELELRAITYQNSAAAGNFNLPTEITFMRFFIGSIFSSAGGRVNLKIKARYLYLRFNKVLDA